MKISVILSADGSGAEAFPFLKLGAVLPASFFMVYLFTRFSNHFDREKVFYLMLSFFLVFFAVFAFFVFPNREIFELEKLAFWLSNNHFMPEGFSGFITIIRHWVLSLFYVICEMWSTIVLSMLFWGFANEVTKVNEAKRFYAIFALGANSSGIVSGQAAQFLKVDTVKSFLPFSTIWDQTIFLQVSLILILGAGIMVIFWWLNHSIFKKEILDSDETLASGIAKLKNKKSKEKLSLKECFSYLLQSRYMIYIVILVLGYHIVHNLADVIWNDRVFHAFNENPILMNGYINNVTSVTGIIAVFFAFFISGNVIRLFGWLSAAMIAPVIWLLTSTGFFICLFSQGTVVGDVIAVFLSNPINLALLISSAQVCLGRASKYTVFDETKEIAFIPLSQHEQRKGKAVIDGIVSRLGKSGGAVICIVLFSLLGSVSATIPYLAGIMFIMIVLWMLAAHKLGIMVNETIDQEKVSDRNT